MALPSTPSFFSVSEKTSNNTVVSTLSGIDPNDGDTHTFTLTDDAGGRFKIVGNQLQVANASVFDFETAPLQQISIKVSDQGGLNTTFTKQVLLQNANEAPTSIALSGQQPVAERAAAHTVVGQLSTVDPDAGDSVTYEILNNDGAFEIAGNKLRVANGLLIDFEAAASRQVTIKATDAGGLSTTVTETITVTNVNDAPYDITLSGQTVKTEPPNGALVGNILAFDQDANDTFTASLTDNAGGRFMILGNQLLVRDGSLIDYDVNHSHNVTIHLVDSGGLSYDETFTISLALPVNGTPGDDVITLTGDGSVSTGKGNDKVYGSDGNNKISTGSGNDKAYGGGGSDRINTGTGSDTAKGGGGSDILFMAAGDDRAGGGLGADIIYGGDGNDKLSGGAGRDRIYGGRDDDVLIGGAGNDKLYAGDAYGKHVNVDSDYEVRDEVHIGNDMLHGGDGNDTFYAGNGANTVYGGDGDDTITALFTINTAAGIGDDDAYDGGAGNDTLILDIKSTDVDIVRHGAGAATLSQTVGAGGFSFKTYTTTVEVTAIEVIHFTDKDLVL